MRTPLAPVEEKEKNRYQATKGQPLINKQEQQKEIKKQIER